ncbi:hypothetical protein ACX93W_18780 [Paenibacillus sp. CAU 1782]
MLIAIFIILVLILGMLVHINSKIPPRDYVKEAEERDLKHKEASNKKSS